MASAARAVSPVSVNRIDLDKLLVDVEGKLRLSGA
jgi:hypothetical protein